MTDKGSARETVLVVEDSVATLEVIERNLRARGHRVFTAGSALQAISVLDGVPVDLVITDMKMPGPSGLELVRYVKENYADTEVMMITGYATVEGAVEAVKSGAREYLPKPFTDEELFAAVDRALERLHVRRAASPGAVSPPAAPHGILGDSAPMRHVYAVIEKAARTGATVLVAGESGTGKELVARAIHYGGPRSSSPFVAVNCGGIPESLLESELFGYVKGAFTGAADNRIGLFQAADGGTIFLDEVAETSLKMQVKLLRVLQEKEICPVGSAKTRALDVRVIAATNKDLAALVEKKLFREDLFYRLNVVAIELPPLRDRGDDVLELTRHFAARFARSADRPVPTFTDAALDALRRHNWPGNVRALENILQRLIVLTDSDTIEVTDLPPLMRFGDLACEPRLDRTLAEVELDYIAKVMARVNENKTKAAKILGIDRKTLREKLRRMEAAGGPAKKNGGPK